MNLRHWQRVRTKWCNNDATCIFWYFWISSTSIHTRNKTSCHSIYSIAFIISDKPCQVVLSAFSIPASCLRSFRRRLWKNSEGASRVEGNDVGHRLCGWWLQEDESGIRVCRGERGRSVGTEGGEVDEGLTAKWGCRVGSSGLLHPPSMFSVTLFVIEDKELGRDEMWAQVGKITGTPQCRGKSDKAGWDYPPSSLSRPVPKYPVVPLRWGHHRHRSAFTQML